MKVALFQTKLAWEQPETNRKFIEEYFLNAGKVTVRELYRKSKNLVDKQASIMEICFNMITEGRTRLYVVENDKYFGMIERRDIIKKFLHI